MNNVARIPIINLYSNLIVPIQALLPDAALDDLQREVTRRIITDRAEGLILDVSAVAAIDSYFTRVLRDLAMTARLMGTRTVLCGVPATVAITVVEMGLDLPGVVTTLDLERAIEHLQEAKARGDLDELEHGASDGDG